MTTPEISFQGKTLRVGSKQVSLDFPIKDIAPVDDLIVVLYEYDSYQGSGQFRNLFAVDVDGKEVWRAEHPSNETSDTYVEFISKDPLVVWNFACYRCRIDETSGKFIEAVFTK